MTEVRVNKRKVCCHGDGNDKGYDHPVIYLDMGEEREIACPYCKKTFIHDYTVKAVKEETVAKDKLYSIRSEVWQG